MINGQRVIRKVVRNIKERQGYFNSEFRAKETDNNLFLDGYFIRFNEETELWQGVFEEVAPESIVGSLKNDIRCLFNHDTGLVLGRTGNNTLQLKADDVGLFGSVEINQDDPEAMSIYSRVKRGDIDACSFGFTINHEEIEKREDGTTKIVLRDINVHEVSIVTFPAYPTTAISARKKDIDEHKKEMLERMKNKVKERLDGIKTANPSKTDGK